MKKHLLFALSALMFCACAKTEAPETDGPGQAKQHKFIVATESYVDETVRELTDVQKMALARLIAPSTRSVGSIMNMADATHAIMMNPKVVVTFGAAWCGPCKMLNAQMSSISDGYPNWSFYKVDVDLGEDVAAYFEIEAIPTTLFFNNGVQDYKVVGADMFKIQSYLNSNNKLY